MKKYQVNFCSYIKNMYNKWFNKIISDDIIMLFIHNDINN
jgi:hypothetical protein